MGSQERQGKGATNMSLNEEHSMFDQRHPAVAMRRLIELQKKMRQGLPLNLSVGEIIRLVKVGCRLERLARGEQRDRLH